MRTIIAIAYIAKHAFYTKKIEEADKARTAQLQQERVTKETERNKKVKQAVEKSKNSSGVEQAAATLGELFTRVETGIDSIIDDLTQTVEEATQEIVVGTLKAGEKVKRERWEKELGRGLTELFWIGAPYYSYQDNFGDRKVSTYGWDELRALIREEEAADVMIRELLGKEKYNPWF